jgi:outer membrane biosynthesis protein TonB
VGSGDTETGGGCTDAPTEIVPPPAAVAAPPAAPPENGISAIQGVTLSSGVPDLPKGRRPVVPPLARMGNVKGSVEVRFTVDSAGTASVRSSHGPELLAPAAEATVSSWVFRRTSAERLFLVAVFNYGDTGADAEIHPEPH